MRAAVSAAAVVSLSLTLAGCSNLATFLADNIPQWAGGLPKDAPPRAGHPRYAEYFKTQLAVRKSIEERQVAGVQTDEQIDRIERAQGGGHMSRSVSARSFVRDVPVADHGDDAGTHGTTGFSLSGRTLY